MKSPNPQIGMQTPPMHDTFIAGNRGSCQNKAFAWCAIHVDVRDLRGAADMSTFNAFPPRVLSFRYELDPRVPSRRNTTGLQTGFGRIDSLNS